MRELAARAEVTEERALARRHRADADDVEDAEFEDHPVRALGRRERDLAEPAVRSSPWVPVAVGLGIVALIGVAGVIVYLLVRRKDNGETSVLGAVDPRVLPQPIQQQAPQVYLINAGGGQASVTHANPPQSDNAMLSMLGRIENGIGSLVHHNKVPYNQSTMRTYRLPWLADVDNPAIRIATAGNVSMEATVRVVSPPGALAAFSFSANELNIPQRTIGPGMSTVPAGDTLVIPAGQQQEIHMNPKQVLYAKGNFGNQNPTGTVVVSISTVDNYVSR